jgi:hypothetical protein
MAVERCYRWKPYLRKRPHGRYAPDMPRGDPKPPIMLRISRELREAVAAYGVPFTRAVEEGVALWLALQKRGTGKADRWALPLAPSTCREIAARKDETA